MPERIADFAAGKPCRETEDVERRIAFQRLAPETDIVHTVEIAENVQAQHKPRGVITLQRQELLAQGCLKVFARRDPFRRLHVVAVAIRPGRACPRARRPLLKREREDRPALARSLRRELANLPALVSILDDPAHFVRIVYAAREDGIPVPRGRMQCRYHDAAPAG